LRGSPIAAAIGTAIGNPITFPFIWMAIYKTGIFFIPSFKMETKVHFWRFFVALKDTLINFDVEQFFDKIYPIFFPMLIGSIPYYIFTFVVSYFLIRILLKNFRIARKIILQKHKEHADKSIENKKLKEKNSEQ
jgi:uncharacterized protein (DUF2062 family)